MSVERSIINRENAKKRTGTKTVRTLIREQVMKEMYQRIFLMSHKLINAQMIQAIGTHKMIQIMNGPNNTKITRTIRSMDEQQKLLDEGIYGVDYVVLEGRPQDWKAADALLNRAFGKAKETFDINQTTEVINPEAKKSADDIIRDYLTGKRGFTVENKTEPVKADNFNFKNG